MRLRGRMWRLEKLAEGLIDSFELEDGTVYKYTPEDFMEALRNFFARLWAEDNDCIPDSEPHPFILNLRRATRGERERLIQECGLIGLIINEDELFRDEKEDAEHGLNPPQA